MATGKGTKESPWKLKTPPGTSEYTMYRDDSLDPPAIVCKVGTTELRYDARCIDDLHAMLKKHGDWMELGSADEQKPAKEGTVEAWARSPKNPNRRLVRPAQGLSGTLRNVRTAADGSAGACRSRTQPAQQPHAREVNLRLRACGAPCHP